MRESGDEKGESGNGWKHPVEIVGSECLKAKEGVCEEAGEGEGD